MKNRRNPASASGLVKDVWLQDVTHWQCKEVVSKELGAREALVPVCGPPG